MFGFSKKKKTSGHIKSLRYAHTKVSHPFRNDPVNKSRRYTKRTGKFKLFL